jgi:ligand-binding sensor domain-containing protein
MLAFACQLLSAQEKLLPVFHFDRLTTANGLPSNEVKSKVVRDRDGFVWIGTGFGLARYDGYGCKVYVRDPRDPSSLSGTHVGALLCDRRGRLWIGTLESGLSLYDADHDHFVNFLPRRGDSEWIQTPAVTAIFEDRSGNIWCGTDRGLVRIIPDPGCEDADADSLAHHIRFRTFCQDTVLDDIWDIDELDDGTVIAASTGGVFGITIDGERRAFQELLHGRPSLLDTAIVRALERDEAGRLWLGTKFHGLMKYEPANHAVTSYQRTPSGLTNQGKDQIWDLQFDGSGRLWVTTEIGLDLFDPSAGRYVNFLAYADFPGESWMSSLLSFDATGTLWITTGEEGVYVLHPTSFRLPNLGLRGTGRRPREMSRIDAWNDTTCWVESEGRVVELDLSTLTVRQSVDLLGSERGKYGQSAWDSYVDRSGHLWYGTWGLGLFKFDPASGRVENFRYSKQLPSLRYKSDICRSIAHWQGDTLVIATHDDGLLKFDTRTNRFFPFASGWRSEVTRAADGSVWVTDEIGSVFVYNPPTGESRVFIHDPDDSTSLSEGRTWIT